MSEFYLNNGQTIKNIEELFQILPKLDDATFNFHVNESKNDFSTWIKDIFKKNELADKLQKQTKKEMIKTLKEFLKTEGEKILVINAGSSSLKFQLIDVKSKKPLIKGGIDGIGLTTCKIISKIGEQTHEETKEVKDYDVAIEIAIELVKTVVPLSEIKAIGHRVVHGGEAFKDSVLITDEVIKKIDELSALAPLHNPPNLKGILSCKKILPTVPEVAVFDTAFHATLSKESYMYAIPKQFYDKYKIRKYGFHGTSHNYVYKKACASTKKKLDRVITCHLGNGCSVAAILHGKSIETSMGFTPLQGLVMGTRSGDIDPEIVEFISVRENISVKDTLNILNKKSGLLGLSGHSDMREIRATIGEPNSKLAYDVTVHRLVHYIGAYIALLNGVDAIIFTAGVGEGAWYLREAVIKHFKYLKISIDLVKNKNGDLIISDKTSKVLVMVVPTNEELEIALQTEQVIAKTKAN